MKKYSIGAQTVKIKTYTSVIYKKKIKNKEMNKNNFDRYGIFLSGFFQIFDIHIYNNIYMCIIVYRVRHLTWQT